MSAEIPPHPRHGRRLAIVAAGAVTIAVIAAIAPPFAQPESYHAFADQRMLLGVVNLFDVVSNLAFLIVGVGGLLFVFRGRHPDGSQAFQETTDRWAWGVVFAATALTCCGSAYYHLAPDSPRLAWDRLPMAVGFMALVAAVVSERIGPRVARLLHIPLYVLGAWSVWHWRWSAAAGIESLNAYAAVQFGSVLVIVLMLTLLPPRYTRSRDYLGAFAIYGLAKVAEHFDAAIFAATRELVSGHTLKHLLAAMAMLWLLRMLRLRAPVDPATTLQRQHQYDRNWSAAPDGAAEKS